jgi:hypothetical protein
VEVGALSERKSERAGYRPAAEKRRIEEFIGVISVV